MNTASLQKISVIGLGKLGACLAALFAGKGFSVIGVDVNPWIVEAVNKGKAPVDETFLQEAFLKAEGNLKATSDYRIAIHETEATFVIVPTPSEARGGFSLAFVREAFQEIGKVLKNKSTYHLVVLTSTLLPGATEYGLLPVLEKASGKKCGRDFGLCYNPQFIALGSVLSNLSSPDFVLIGESDKEAGELLAEFYKKVCENHPPIARMSIINAELTKVAVNTFMTMKISFANMLASLCENLPGGDVDQVTQAVGLFQGIGPKYLNAGLGYGGPCLPRDNLALSFLAKQLDQKISVPHEVDQFNHSVVERISKVVLKYANEGDCIAILGLAYKASTGVIEESQGLQLADLLATKGFEVIVYDPKALETAKTVLKEKVKYASSAEEALKNADVIVLTVPDPLYKSLPIPTLTGKNRPVVVDAWRYLRKELSQEKRVRYVPIGIGEGAPLLIQRLSRLWG